LQPPAALPARVSGIVLVRADAIRASPFTRGLARATGRIEFAGAADGAFTWGCSPPPLVRTQLPSVTRPPDGLGEDFHLAGSLRSKAQECGAFRRFGIFASFAESKRAVQAATPIKRRTKYQSGGMRRTPKGPSLAFFLFGGPWRP